MKTLSITQQPAPEHAPDLDMTGVACPTATVIPKRGDEFWVCNPLDELIDAMESDEPFVAHQVRGMQAKQVIIMPGTIARIQEA